MINERLERIKNGECIYIYYDGEIERVYAFYECEKFIVKAKKKKSKAVELDYDKSKESKDALYMGKEITAEEYESW